MTKTNRFADKIARMRAGAYKPGDYMIADAKDADGAPEQGDAV